jgi:kynureninase
MTDVGPGSAASRALARARDLDAADPLRAYPDRFVVGDPDFVYLDGNSLGRLPRATVDRRERVIRAEWGGEVVRAWDPWLTDPLALGERSVTTSGARSATIATSTTVNLCWLASAAFEARPDLTVVVAACDRPDDRYVLEGLADWRG